MSKGQDIMARVIKTCFGFLTAQEVAEIAADPETRLEGLLVRCGGGRFLAPAQDVAHFIGIIEREAGDTLEPESDYVRDVSVPAGWTPEVGVPLGWATRPAKGGTSFDPLKAVRP